MAAKKKVLASNRLSSPGVRRNGDETTKMAVVSEGPVTETTTTLVSALPKLDLITIASTAHVWLTGLAELTSSAITPAQRAQVGFAVKKLKKVLESHEKMLVSRLKEDLAGATLPDSVSEERTPEGRLLSRHVVSGKLKAALRFPRAATPSAGLVEALLEGKKLPPTAGMDPTVSFSPNLAKLEGLVRARKLTSEELEACYPSLTPTLVIEEEETL